MASFLVRADVATIDEIDAAVTAMADRLTGSMPGDLEDERRVRAVLLLCHPGAEPDADVTDLLPKVQLYVHTYAATDCEVARLEGHGPVTAAWIRKVLGPQCRFKVTPVLDLAGQAPVDAYEIPDRHRQAVHLMTPADTFPYASSCSRRMQVDHTVPYDQGGVSGVGNYAPMTTRHHRIKTHARWHVHQPFPGIYLWRDPHGGHYLVDHTGTRPLRSAPSEKVIRARPIAVEIYRHSIPLDLDRQAFRAA